MPKLGRGSAEYATVSAIGAELSDGAGDKFEQITETFDQNGQMSTSTYNYVTGVPFASGTGVASVFSLQAWDGTSASWDGTPTTFTFSTTSTAMPERGSTVLFLVMDLAVFAGMAMFLRRKLVPVV